MPIKIRSKRAGFRRCGKTHPAEWVVHPDGAFSPEEVARLQAEPMLQVEIVDSEPVSGDPIREIGPLPLAPEPGIKVPPLPKPEVTSIKMSGRKK